MSDAIFWVAGAAGLAVAYLLGATPTGYLAGRLLKGVDIRAHGSGSTGATNVLRTLGLWPGVFVLLADLLKGAAAVGFMRWFCGWSFAWTEPPPGLELQAATPWAVCMAGLAVVVGHARSVWLGFTGGKSAATGLGVLLAMSWPIGLAVAVLFVGVVAVFRRVSLGSLLAAAIAIVLVWTLEQPLAYRLLVTAGSVWVIWLHRANIRRLLAGTEPRLGQGVG